MARKKSEEKTEPVISSIPVPPSDSALVIDLPDGQKLLVGKIETGTVIEVATWRGTGRPDSRTNRLMLGMSSESDVNPTPSAESQESKIEVMSKQKKILFAVVQILRKLQIQIWKVLRSLKKVFKLKDSSNLKKLNDLKSIKLPKVFLKKHNEPTPAAELKIEEDFDVDFQRILDEVSQRRSSRPGDMPTGKRSSSKTQKKAKSATIHNKKGKKNAR